MRALGHWPERRGAPRTLPARAAGLPERTPVARRRRGSLAPCAPIARLGGQTGRCGPPVSRKRRRHGFAARPNRHGGGGALRTPPGVGAMGHHGGAAGRHMLRFRWRVPAGLIGLD